MFIALSVSVFETAHVTDCYHSAVVANCAMLRTHEKQNSPVLAMYPSRWKPRRFSLLLLLPLLLLYFNRPVFVSLRGDRSDKSICELECGPMPNMMVALPNTGGASVQRRKVWLTPATRCRAVTLPRRKTRWNWQGCLKLPDGSQLLVGRSSQYCGDVWKRYCCLIRFFPIVDMCLSYEDIARQSCAMSMSMSMSIVNLYSA